LCSIFKRYLFLIQISAQDLYLCHFDFSYLQINFVFF
jgi:hypothetical protein